MKTMRQMKAAAEYDNPIPKTQERASGSCPAPCSGCGKMPTIWNCRTSRPGWHAVQCSTGCRDELEPMAKSEAMAVKGWNAIQASIQND